MTRYRPAGREYEFPCPVLELAPFEVHNTPGNLPASDSPQADPSSLTLIAHTDGLVSGALRRVEVWSAPNGYLLKVSEGSNFFISTNGESIHRNSDEIPWPRLDREILVGPALVLALALQNVWSLHASAIAINGRVLIFLGESGYGKSTLAGFLATQSNQSNLVADDILPVTLEADSMSAWPHFPQLKLPLDRQPGPPLPERLPVGGIYLLGESSSPSLEKLPAPNAIQALLRHTAGTRMFPPELLASHLTFCAQAAAETPTMLLSYPRRMDALPDVQSLLETLC